ncbi:MAG: hypothetical protein VXY93_20125, partial [Pseudomonadota bacterium]|nr:hypothetical protein [Pseudomonadota bacterium]
SHNGMIGNIYITGGASWQTTDVNTSTTEEIFTLLNVGIGTDNPLNLLDVNQSSGRQRFNKYGHYIAKNNGASTTEYWTFAPRNNGKLGIGRGVPDGEGTVVAANDKLIIKSTGEVGIGTDNPLSLLTLGASANPSIEFKDYTNNARSLITGSAGGQLVFQTDINSVNPNSDFIFRADSVSNEIVRFK